MSIPSLYAPPTAQASEPEISQKLGLAEVIEIARRRRTLILGVASVVIFATLILLMLIPQRYVASAIVVLEGRKNNVADQSAVLASLPTDPASMQNQIQILTSRDLAGRVVDRLHLTRDEEFAPSGGITGGLFGGIDNSAAAVARRRNQVIDKVLDRLSVDVIGLSSTLSVSFGSVEPGKAANVANAVVDAYVAGQVSAKVDASERATFWLQRRIRQLAAQVEDAEGAVQRYKARHNLSDAPDGTSLVDQQMLAINTQLMAARAELAQKEAARARSATLLASGHAADASQVVASPLIVQLRQQEAQLAAQQAQLSTRYGPRHPKMLEIESQRLDLNAKIEDEVGRIAGSMSNDVAASRAQVASLQASLARAQRESSGQGTTRIELKALLANAQSTRTMYESFVSRLRETQDQTEIQTPDSRIVSRASPPVSPAPPRRSLLFAASIPAALLLGLLIALVSERFGPRVNLRRRPVAAPAQSEETPALPPPPPPPPRDVAVLAEFPDLGQLSASTIPAADYVIDYPASGFARAVAALDRQIATNQWRAPKVLVVTCAERGVARTAIALSLARAASQRGQRVLVIDGDAKTSAVLPMARAQRSRGGIAEVVVGAAPLSRSIAHDARSNVMLLSWMARPARMHELLSSLRMRQLMVYLRDACDLVIIDAPPVAEAEGGALVAYADAVLLVADGGERGKAATVDALARLEDLQAPTIGIAQAG